MFSKISAYMGTALPPVDNVTSREASGVSATRQKPFTGAVTGGTDVYAIPLEKGFNGPQYRLGGVSGLRLNTLA
jgi:hypothetical protein